jgi:RNA-directed DNA polymerase
MRTAIPPRSQGQTIRWPMVERTVLKRQKRLDRAEPRGDDRHVRSRQQLRRRSHDAQRVAVRQVTQDHRGEKTPGVEGIAALTPPERLALAAHLPLDGHAAPVHRVSMPNPGPREPRPVGIPPITARAKPGVVQEALEPAWEATVEPHSDGCRPGRSTWDALGARSVQINPKPTGVRAADLATGCDRIDHDAVFRKRDAPPTLSRPLTTWLQAGVWDRGDWPPTDAGTPPGGPRAPV